MTLRFYRHPQLMVWLRGGTENLCEKWMAHWQRGYMDLILN